MSQPGRSHNTDSTRLQFYDAPHQMNSNVFLTRRAAMPLADARTHLEAPVNASDPASGHRCPLAPGRMDALLDPAHQEFRKPAAFCRCATAHIRRPALPPAHVLLPLMCVVRGRHAVCSAPVIRDRPALRTSVLAVITCHAHDGAKVGSLHD